MKRKPKPAAQSNAAQTPPAWIPEQWTFNDPNVASRFDRHVREQLPWYDTLLTSIAHFGAHYIRDEGLVYDIGASTGNVGHALAPFLIARRARFEAIEKAPEMVSQWTWPDGRLEHQDHRAHWKISCHDALTYAYKDFDFAVINLVLMFMPAPERGQFVRMLCDMVKPGGAIVIVEKVISPPGYLGTVFGRLAMRWKLASGTPVEEVLAKELSLAGVQRPINPGIIPVNATRFFQFGEFVGWIYEREERGTD